MLKRSIQIDLPDEVLKLLNESDKELALRLRRSLAVHLYTQEILSLGKSAQLAAMSRMEFEHFLGQHHIPVSLLNISDVMSDVDKLDSK